MPRGDVAALAAAMRRLVEHPEEARAMGAAGRARARQRFTVAHHVEAVSAVYDRLR